MFRIRFHGRGGQGVKTAGCILGDAFFAEGFEVQDAPRYGAERRGAPIFAYVRADRRPIHERGIITRPDLVVVADDTLVPMPAAGVLQGTGSETVLLIHGAVAAAEWRDRLKFAGAVVQLPSQEASIDRAAMPYVGAACAGAAARLTGVIGRAALETAISAQVGGLGGEALAQSRAHALAAYDALEGRAGLVREGAAAGPATAVSPEWIDLPLDGAESAAPDIHATTTSLKAQTGQWRVQRPVLDEARCHRCSWICSTFCPDSAIAVAGDHLPVIDYDHCKGCLVCVAVCPRHAIAAVPEATARGAT